MSVRWRSILVVPVLLMAMCSARAYAQPAGFLSVNFGSQAAAKKDFAQHVSIPFRLEQFVSDSSYTITRAPTFDIGGGLMFSKVLGIGVGVSRGKSVTDGTIKISLPHPFAFNRPATDEEPGDDLDRTETGTHIALVVSPPIAGKARISLFAGPSRIAVRQRLIEDVDVEETIFLTTSTVLITDLSYETASANAWGFHAGADVAYMLTPVVGFGGSVRFSRATVKLKDVLDSKSDDDDQFDDQQVGGASFFVGLRLAFGKS